MRHWFRKTYRGTRGSASRDMTAGRKRRRRSRGAAVDKLWQRRRAPGAVGCNDLKFLGHGVQGAVTKRRGLGKNGVQEAASVVYSVAEGVAWGRGRGSATG